MKEKYILLLILLLLFTTGFTFKDWRNQMAEGNKKFLNGQIDDAIQEFNQAMIDAPDEPGIHYNLGNALYSKGSFTEAREQYLKALELSQDNQLNLNAEYNLGNIEYRLGESLLQQNPQEALNKYEAALQHYKTVIKENPADEDAKYNYEFVKEKIKNLKKQMEKQEKDSQKSEENQNNDQNEGKENQNNQTTKGENQQSQQSQQNQKDSQENQERYQKEQENMNQAGQGENNQADQQEGQDSVAPFEERTGSEKVNQEQPGLSQEEALQLIEQFKEENGMFIPIQPKTGQQSGTIKDW